MKEIFKGLRRFLRKDSKDIVMNVNSTLSEEFLFDFKDYLSNTNSHTSFITVSGSISGDGVVSQTKENSKIKIKPIEVLNELETFPTPFSLINLEEKITMLKFKGDLIKQEYSKRELNGLIERLENRKKYKGETLEYFEKFLNTNEEKIEKLLNKYELVMKTSDIFIPEFPDEAIHIMKEYSNKVFKLFKKKPVFYVIAEEDKFRKAYEKRDPILLVQSPFGFYYQILGAWDKEMLILHEL